MNFVGLTKLYNINQNYNPHKEYCNTSNMQLRKAVVLVMDAEGFVF